MACGDLGTVFYNDKNFFMTEGADLKRVSVAVTIQPCRSTIKSLPIKQLYTINFTKFRGGTKRGNMSEGTPLQSP